MRKGFVLMCLMTLSFVALSQGATARLQVIHNAADPAAASVDIYVNGNRLLEDFRFRKATPFIDVPAGVELVIGVAPGGSSSAADIIATLPAITLESGTTYVAIANGVLAPGNFSANPEGKHTGFQLLIKTMAREKTSSTANTDIMALHGVTDAPKVDLSARELGAITSGFGYTDKTDYLTVPANRYVTVDVKPTGAANVVVGSYLLSLYKHGGEAAVVFASGFLDPAVNQNGKGFGLFVAYPDGRVDALKPLTSAKLQIIHNAADPAAALVDVYVNGALALDNFAFRAATPFLDLPAAKELSVAVAPSTSTSVADAIATFKLTLMGGMTYVGFAQGVVGTGFAANPDNLTIAFNVFVIDYGQMKAKWKRYVELAVMHGVTDAPTVDVKVAGSNITLVDDLKFGSATPYVRVDPGTYKLNITPGNDPAVVVASFDADLSALAGGSAVVFASGFLTPSANNNGPAFGLYAALPTGQVIALPAATALNKLAGSQPSADQAEFSAQPVDFGLQQNYPNPFNPSTTISFGLPEAAQVRLEVFNMLGERIATLVEGDRSAGRHYVSFNAADLASGRYFYRLQAGSSSVTRQMILLR